MLCSVGYHMFSCHRSEKTCRRWLALDYAGISVGILGCYVPGIFYAFYCDAVSMNVLLWRSVLSLSVCHRCRFVSKIHQTTLSSFSNLSHLCRLLSSLAVLAAGLPGDRSVSDPGSLLRSGPPSLPQQRLAAAANDALLLCGWHRRDPIVSLGLAEWGIHLGRCTGLELMLEISQISLNVS